MSPAFSEEPKIPKPGPKPEELRKLIPPPALAPITNARIIECSGGTVGPARLVLVWSYGTGVKPEKEGSRSFLGRTPLPATIGPRARVTLNLAQTYTVSGNAGDQIQLTLYLPAITPGVEFGPGYQYKFNASCTYNPEIRLISLPLGTRPIAVPGK